MPPKSKKRTRRGGALVEAAAAMVLLLPLFMLLLTVTTQVVQAYLIKDAMTSACHQAARQMTICYWQDNSIATNRALQNAYVYDNLRVKNILVDSAQFSDAVFNLTANPPSVSVSCTYTGGKYGLPVFPRPDVMHLGTNFTISSVESHALE